MKNSIFKSYTKKILRSEAFVSVIIVFVLALGMIGSSYALYMDVDSDTDYQLVEVGDLRIDFDHADTSTNPADYSKITLSNMTPMEDEIGSTQTDNIFSFRIYNTGTYDVDYKIKLVTVDGNGVDTKYINYQICKDNANCNDIQTLSNVNDSVIRSGQIKAPSESESISDYYFLRVWINNEYPETEWTKDNTIVLRVMIEASNVSEKSLAYNIINNAKSGIEGRTVYTEPADLPTKIAEEGAGREKVLSYTEDDLGYSYYFRGNVEDNYVNFADMCWRIVRIEGDGSVKLTLEDQDEVCSTTMNGNFGIPINTGATTYTGNYGYNYDYIINSNGTTSSGKKDIMNYLQPVIEADKSMVKAFYDFQTNKLDGHLNKLKSGNWCLANDGYSQSGESDSYSYTLLTDIQMLDYKIAITQFYYDSYVRLVAGNVNGFQPTLECTGIKMDSYKSVTYNSEEIIKEAPMYVGALTADEMVYAGGRARWTSSNVYLLNEYLESENTEYNFFFSLSSDYNFGGGDFVFSYSCNGLVGTSGVDSNHAFRPSVSLKSGTMITDGDGTIEKPYTIG